jgi:hypothetical protein
MVKLHLVPKIFQRNYFCFVALPPRGTLRKGQGKEYQQGRKSASHGISSFSEPQIHKYR